MKKKINLNTHFAQLVIAAAQTGCNALTPGDVREERQLCGIEFWDKLSKKKQPKAGQIVSQAVDDGLLPLIKLKRSQSNHQRYECT
jgi:hypothetical protein